MAYYLILPWDLRWTSWSSRTKMMMSGRFWFELDRLFEFRVLFETTFFLFSNLIFLTLFYFYFNNKLNTPRTWKTLLSGHQKCFKRKQSLVWHKEVGTSSWQGFSSVSSVWSLLLEGYTEALLLRIIFSLSFAFWKLIGIWNWCRSMFLFSGAIQ